MGSSGRDRGEHARAGSDEVADLRLHDPGDAVHRRGDAGEVEIELGLLDRGLGRGNLRLGGEVGLHGVIQLLLADRLVLGQGPVALHVLLGLAQLGLGLGQLGLGAGQRRLEGARIDFEEQVAAVHPPAFLQ